jgi:hypothetical protein
MELCACVTGFLIFKISKIYPKTLKKSFILIRTTQKKISDTIIVNINSYKKKASRKASNLKNCFFVSIFIQKV